MAPPGRRPYCESRALTTPPVPAETGGEMIPLAPSAAPEAEPDCACTGIRWCRHCRAPHVRAQRGMHPPRPLPSVFSGTLSLPRVPERWTDRGRSAATDAISGLTLVPDFLEPSEAAAILREVSQRAFALGQSGVLKQHFGPRYNFKKRRIRSAGFRGLPPFARHLRARIETHLSLHAPSGHRRKPTRPLVEDAFVLRYLPARQAHLDFHVDDPFAYGPDIFVLSLEGRSALSFIEAAYVDRPQDAPCGIRVPLPERSLLILSGAARTEWAHAILAQDIHTARTSVTLRSISDTVRHTAEGRRTRRIARWSQP